MIHNQIIDTLMNRKSIRKCLLLKKNSEKADYQAPLLFTICFDMHKLEKIMRKRNWPTGSCDLLLLTFGWQDAVLMSENLVIAAESLGMGSCFIGSAPFRAKTIIKEYNLPERVFPIVQLTVGFPDENPPTRPRYPLDYFLFEDRYPELTDQMVDGAMKEMDDGYLAQDYYRGIDYMVPLENDREETFTFEKYSWTEHMGRKWGQWGPSPKVLLEALNACGFDLNSSTKKK